METEEVADGITVTRAKKPNIFQRIKQMGAEYKAREPERRQKALERMQYKLEKEKYSSQIQEARNKTQLSRVEVQNARLGIDERRSRLQAARPMPTMFGGSMQPRSYPESAVRQQPPSMAQIFGAAPMQAPMQKARKVRHKRAKQRVKYITKVRYVTRRRRR